MARLNECILYRNFEHGERKGCSLSVPTDWWKLPALMAFPEIYGTVI